MTAQLEDGIPRLPLARRLGTQTLYLVIGSVFTLAVGFPLQIYVARKLGADGLGIFGLLEATVATISGIVALGIAPTAMRFIPAYLERREFTSIRILLRAAVLILTLVGAIAYLGVLGGLKWADAYWPELGPYHGELALMALTIPLGLLLYLLQQSLRGLQDIRHMVFGSSFLQLSVKAAAALSAFALGFALSGYVFAVVLSMACAVAWMAAGLLRKLREMPGSSDLLSGETKRQQIKDWLRFAMITHATNLLGALTAGLDRYILAYVYGPTSVGVLVVVMQLQQLPKTFNQMLLTAGAPMLAAAHGRDDSEQRQHLYALMTDWVVRATLPLVMFLLIFGFPLLSLYGSDFAIHGYITLRLFVGAVFFSIVTGPLGSVALMNGLEGSYLRAASVSTVLSRLAILSLVPFVGLIGSGIGAVIGNVYMDSYLMIVVRRRLGLHWWDRRFGGWLLPSLATLSLAGLVAESAINLGVVELGAILVAMYVVFAGVSLIQGLHKDDKDLLRHVRDRLLRRPAQA